MHFQHLFPTPMSENVSFFLQLLHFFIPTCFLLFFLHFDLNFVNIFYCCVLPSVLLFFSFPFFLFCVLLLSYHFMFLFVFISMDSSFLWSTLCPSIFPSSNYFCILSSSFHSARPFLPFSFLPFSLSSFLMSFSLSSPNACFSFIFLCILSYFLVFSFVLHSFF